jgi:hypothetical protein
MEDSGRVKREAFYIATSAVIPLLFIASAIEARLFTEKALKGFMYEPIGDAIFRLGLIGMMVWGEAEALIALESGRESGSTVVGILAAFLAGGIVVVGPMVRFQIDAITEQSQKAGLIVSIVVLLVIIGATIVLSSR